MLAELGAPPREVDVASVVRTAGDSGEGLL